MPSASPQPPVHGPEGRVAEYAKVSGGDVRKGRGAQSRDRVELSEEAQKIRELAARDREVRAHEAAHASVGGQYAGAPSYTYERGPDGRSYAVGGEVPISTSPIPDDPEATLKKAETVRAAALAPADPSPEDRSIAAKATRMATEARGDIAALRAEEQGRAGQESPSGQQKQDQDQRAVADSTPFLETLRGNDLTGRILDLQG